MATDRKAAIGFIFITLLIDVMGWGLIIPVMPDLISQLKGISVNEASPYGAWLLSVYAFTQFVFAPVIGNLSDRYGRRPVLLVLYWVLVLIIFFSPWRPLMVGYLLAVLSQELQEPVLLPRAAYIADISTEETRAKNFGLIGAAFGLGFVIGPALGGLLAGWGVRAPFYAAASSLLIKCAIWIFCFAGIIKQRKPAQV